MKFKDGFCVVIDIWSGLNISGKIVLFPIIVVLTIIVVPYTLLMVIVSNLFFKK